MSMHDAPPDPLEQIRPEEAAKPFAPPRTIPVTGVILCGGRGSRMGYVDKGLQTLRGKRLVEYAIERLAPQVDQLVINANQNLEVYAEYGYPVLPDITPDYAGPLAGIEAALAQCATPYLVTAPCDVPFFPDFLVARLAHDLLRNDADVAFPITGYGVQRESHPVFALLKTSLLPDLSVFLKHGGHKMLAWFATKNMTRTFFENEDSFRNLNTLDDLRQMEG